MKHLEPRVAGHDPHDTVSEQVVGQVELLYLVQVEVGVQCW